METPASEDGSPKNEWVACGPYYYESHPTLIIEGGN